MNAVDDIETYVAAVLAPLASNSAVSVSELEPGGSGAIPETTGPAADPGTQFGEPPFAGSATGGGERDRKPGPVSTTDTTDGTGGPPPQHVSVPRLLRGWNEIITALSRAAEPGASKWTNDERTQRYLRKLNERFGGPIVQLPGKGRLPEAVEGELLNWASGLKEEFARLSEAARERTDSERLTVEYTHRYGSTGTVVPGIGGYANRPIRPKGRQR